MKKQTYLITGGAGFIGTNLAEQLVAAGNTVAAIDDLSAGSDPSRLPEKVAFHTVDIRDTARVTELCQGVDVVVHLAALPRVQDSIDRPQETHDVNVNGTLSVLEAVRATKARLVFASSSAIYGDQEQLPLTLDLPVQPKSPYALHKYVGERMLQLWSEIYGVKTVSLRFFNVYGPHFDPEGPYALVIGRFLELLQKGEPLTITGDGEQTRDFVHVHDVASAIMQAATLEGVGSGEVFNIGAGKKTSINELADLMGGEKAYVPARLEPKHTMADIVETKKLLNWEPAISLEVGIAELKKEAGLPV